MLIPVVCFSCGTSIGHVAEVFRVLREQRVRGDLATARVAPEMSAIRLDADLDLSDVFDKLRISQDCCRTHLNTAMVMSDHY